MSIGLDGPSFHIVAHLNPDVHHPNIHLKIILSLSEPHQLSSRSVAMTPSRSGTENYPVARVDRKLINIFTHINDY